VARADWIQVGYNRLPNILQRVRYASIRQLESKISEAGPPNMRPSPIHLSEALRARIRRGDVLIQPKPVHPGGLTFPDFYTPADFTTENPDDGARREGVIGLYGTFFGAVNEDHGQTLERTVYNAAREALAAHRWVKMIGSPERPPHVGLVLGGVMIEAPPDLILVGNGGVALVEDKNGRAWMAPWSHDVWELIGKAVRHNAVPVLICRKVLYPLFLLFKQIGGLAFPMHGQMFPEDFTELLARVKHRDGLGFADIRFGDRPPPRLIHFLSATVPDQLAEKLETFRQQKDLLVEFAINRGLESNDLPGGQREAIYKEFYRTLRGEEGEPQEPEVEDW